MIVISLYLLILTNQFILIFLSIRVKFNIKFLYYTTLISSILCDNILWWYRLTASSPKTQPCSVPYRITRMPPAFVDTFPPIWQLPFDPKSNGIMNPWLFKCSINDSRTQPAWHTNTPANNTRTIIYKYILYISLCLEG